MRFLHTSDWQLGMTRHYLDVEAQARFSEARLDAVGRMAELADERDCAFVVVAGDVFETNQPDARTVARALERLERFAMPVYLLPGNHDPFDPASVYRNPVFLRDRPEHVEVLTDDRPRSPCQGVEVVGAPWSSKRPLSDLVGEVCGRLRAGPGQRVVVGHGAVGELRGSFDDPGAIRLDRVEQAVRDAAVHYVALGDRHSCTPVGETGRVWYSGSPEPTSHRERDAGTALVVDLGRDPVEVERMPVGTWSFHVVDHTVDDAADLDELEARLDAIPDPSRAVVRLALRGTLDLAQSVRLEQIVEERRLRFGGLDQPAQHHDVVVRPGDGDLGDLGLTGYAAEARAVLEASASAGGEQGRTAADALGLLLRLAGSGGRS